MVHCFDIQIKICFIFFCCLLKFFVKGFMEGLELQARTDLSRLISAMWKLNILHTISVCWLYFAGCILPVVFCIFSSLYKLNLTWQSVMFAIGNFFFETKSMQYLVILNWIQQNTYFSVVEKKVECPSTNPDQNIFLQMCAD